MTGLFFYGGMILSLIAAGYVAADTEYKALGALWPIIKFSIVLTIGGMLTVYFTKTFFDAKEKGKREQSLANMTESEREKFLTDERTQKRAVAEAKHKEMADAFAASKLRLYDRTNKKIKCKYCQEVGHVRWGNSGESTDAKHTNVTVLGLKTVIGTTTKGSTKMIKIFWCQKCNMDWTDGE